MKRFLAGLGLLLSVSAFAGEIVVQSTLEYQSHMTNHVYNDFHFIWGGVGIDGKVTDNVTGTLLLDFTGNSWLSTGIYYANVDWSLSDTMGLKAGLMDSVFGTMVPVNDYAPMIDLGLQFSQTIGSFEYQLQLVKGDLSMGDGEYFFDASDLNAKTRDFPALQARINWEILKIFTVSPFGRYGYVYDTNEIALHEIGAGLTLQTSKDWIENLTLIIDTAWLYYLASDNSANNLGYYAVGDLGYTFFGRFTPGVRYTVTDQNTEAHDDLDMWLDVYAKIALDTDGMIVLTPKFTWDIASDETTSDKPFSVGARLAFQYQFDLAEKKAE